MSYPTMPNYYGSSSNVSNDQQGYATAKDANQSHTYNAQMRGGRQGQYTANPYGWSESVQNTSIQSTQNMQSNASWHDRMNTSNSTSYNYQPEVYAPSNSTNSYSHGYPPRDTYNSQDTQGLNHLAYASGLEPTAVSNSTVRPSQAQSATEYNSSQPTATTQMRTASPSNPNPRYLTNALQAPTQTPYRAQSDTQSSVNNHNLALNAAAALAGATRSRNSQSNARKSTSTPIGTSVSPNNASSQSVAQSGNYNTIPSYQHSVPAQPSKKISTSSHSSVPGPAKQTPEISVPHVQQPALTTHKATNQQVHTQRDARESIKAIAESQQPPTSNPQSIANLVSDNDETEAYGTIENQDPMPNFIDPTRVFNPYHREHERKKREAAEAATKRKAEEQRLADEKRIAEEQDSRRLIEASTTANSKSKVTKKAHMTIPRADFQGAIQPNSNIASSAPTEDSMAIEMQKMMAKMKEFRTTNPALFQKLWNDMRASGTNTITSSSTAAVQSPSPQVTQASLPANVGAGISVSKPRSKTADSSSALGSVPSNGYKVTVENNPEGLPDLGRFPAERRIRQPYVKKADVRPEPKSPSKNPPVANAAPVQPSATPSRPSEPNSSWPEPRRRAVAIAAVNLLRTHPENSSIEITAEELSSLLERNPSYLDLCTALEARGLKFQRTTFARDLLRNVPELQAPVSKIVAPENQPLVTTSSSSSAPLPVSSSGSPVLPMPQPSATSYGTLREERNSAQVGLSYVGLPGPKSEPTSKPLKQSNKITKARPSASSRPEPPPGSKEAAARKRDFAELIDLTELDNDDNYVLPSKQQRLESELAPNVLKQVDTGVTGVNGGFNNVTHAPLKFNTQPPDQNQSPLVHLPPRTPYSMLGPQSALSGLQQRSTGIVSSKSRMVLAKKVDKSAASQKSYYDPKTVARDILIASGRHPSERPLNLHLAGLIGKLIDLDSDVSTFEWDAVDPGGPPPPRVAYVDIPATAPRFKLGERVRRRHGKLAVIDKTREPREERREEVPTSRTTPIQAQVASLATSPAPASAPSSQRRTQATQNANHSQEELVQPRHYGDASLQQVNGEPAISDPRVRKISVEIPAHSSSQRSTRSISNQTTEQKSAMDGNTASTIKRRGRPPGAKNKNPTVAALKQQAKAVVVETTAEELPQPVLHSYKCRWVKCHAELHNLDTLRRHVLKKHLPDEQEIKEERMVCWWKKCRHLAPDADGNMSPTQTFGNRQEWADHIEEDHVQPIALRYGDGPKSSNTGKQIPMELNLSKFIYIPPVRPVARTVSHIDPQSVEKSKERWLADSNGRSTTPIFSSGPHSDHPPDAMVLTKAYPQGPKNDKEKSDITAQNAFMKAHGAKRQDTRKAAEEVVRAMEDRKAKIGPGLDRGGCTLINEARRNTFLQAPGVSRIVDAEF